MTSSQAHLGRVVIDAPLAAAAQAAARELATRLRDQGLLEVAFQRITQQTLAPDLTRWRSETLSTGDAGLALMCAHLDACFPAEGWDQIGHTHLLKATQETANLPHLHVGLFAGLSGLTHTASGKTRTNRRASNSLYPLSYGISQAPARKRLALYEALLRPAIARSIDHSTRVPICTKNTCPTDSTRLVFSSLRRS